MGVTCLACGFLSFDDSELRRSNRILLAASGENGCPPLNKIHCLRKLWVDYELGNFDDGREGLFEEAQKKCRPCEGFLRYRPGWSPSEHRSLFQAKLERRYTAVITAASAIGGSALTLFGYWLVKRWGIK